MCNLTVKDDGFEEKMIAVLERKRFTVHMCYKHCDMKCTGYPHIRSDVLRAIVRLVKESKLHDGDVWEYDSQVYYYACIMAIVMYFSAELFLGIKNQIYDKSKKKTQS